MRQAIPPTKKLRIMDFFLPRVFESTPAMAQPNTSAPPLMLAIHIHRAIQFTQGEVDSVVDYIDCEPDEGDDDQRLSQGFVLEQRTQTVALLLLLSLKVSHFAL